MACVLVVEDIEINRAVARLYLEDLGHCVREASGGREAICAFESPDIGFVILDLCMPDMDGFAVVRHLRRREAELGRPPARIIALTAMPLEDVRVKCLDCGFDRLASKPVSRDDLVALLS